MHDVVGPPLSPLQAGACIGVGVSALLTLGVFPALLGALGEEHRLSASAIGQTATLELLATGIATAGMGLLRRPRFLRGIAVTASLLLAGVNLLSMSAADGVLMVLRTLAGVSEGVLLWITICMIARTETPERWAGVFFTAQTIAQLVLALAFAAVLIPRWGAAGGFAGLAAGSLVGLAPSLSLPGRFAPLPLAQGQGGAPPARGWIALAATLVFISAAAAVSVYLQPLAHQARLSGAVARTALLASLAAQVVGGATATALAGRVRYFTVFVLASGAYLIAWTMYSGAPPGWLFVGLTTMTGFATIFLSPFLVPMTIDADPSRRAAMQSGAAQLLGAAFGPLLASFVVSDERVHGVLWLAAGLLLTGLVIVAWLRFDRAGTLNAPPPP